MHKLPSHEIGLNKGTGTLGVCCCCLSSCFSYLSNNMTDALRSFVANADDVLLSWGEMYQLQQGMRLRVCLWWVLCFLEVNFSDV